MRWELGRRSQNVQDRRGFPAGRAAAGGGLGMVLLAVVVTLLGGDPSILLDQASAPPDRQNPTGSTEIPANDEQAQFVSAVLADTEDTWNELFQQMGSDYIEPQLVLFSGQVESGCGYAQSAVGPFYCPRDESVYIDLSFYDDLQNRFQAPGDFAQAYVIAHEVGHHVQNLLGISDQVSAAQQRVSQTEANQLSVRLELQADCFAGIWAYHANRSRQILETGDVEEALNAASSIGDDRLQQESRGQVVPEAFTHGSSEQRVRWFERGIESGDPNACNTFETNNL
jgi:uncharacterized protein